MEISKIIAHRINTISQLNLVPKDFGIEVDIRYHEDDLILHHDPFSHHKSQMPEKFSEFLVCYKIINQIKSLIVQKIAIKINFRAMFV